MCVPVVSSFLAKVERNMRLRRKRILSVLRPGEVAPTMTCFPLMGVGDFVSPPDLTGDHAVPPRHASSSGMHVRGPVANSAYVPDDIINPHPRFGALTKNIRVRRGSCFRYVTYCCYFLFCYVIYLVPSMFDFNLLSSARCDDNDIICLSAVYDHAVCTRYSSRMKNQGGY